MDFKIGNRLIGPGHPTYIIAELSANHGQDFDLTVRIIKAMKESGAYAVKVQTYTADSMTIASDKPPFLIGGARFGMAARCMIFIRRPTCRGTGCRS